MKQGMLILLLSLPCVMAYPQTDKELLFKSTDFVWCGLDYSNVKCIGPEGFNEPDQIKHKYFEAWNNLMIQESEKYNFKKAYYKLSQVTDLSAVDIRNEIPEIDQLVIEGEYRFPKGLLKEIIKEYDLTNIKEGLGLTYIVESLNKTRQVATIYVVFFNIATRDILWAKRFTEPAAGFGFRNYWARPIYETIKTSGKMYRYEQKRYIKGKS